MVSIIMIPTSTLSVKSTEQIRAISPGILGVSTQGSKWCGVVWCGDGTISNQSYAIFYSDAPSCIT